MLALRKTAAAPGLELIEAPAPGSLAATEVLIAVEAAGICGSDLHVEEWSAGYEFMLPLLPVTLGHEFSGRVTAVGSEVKSVNVGQRVTAWPSAPCGVCRACKSGQPQNCTDKRTVGLYRDGAFASHVVVRENGVFPLPEAVDFELAALIEPLCVGARAVNVGEVRQGHRVVVLGPGTIGQAIAMFARMSGALSIAVAGFNDGPRLETVNRLGFADTFDLADAASANELAGRFAGADVVFEATGHASSIADGMKLLRNEGTLVLTGIHAESALIDLLAIVRRKLQLRGSHGARREDWARVIETLGNRGEDFRPMITHRLPLTQALEGFALARSRSASKVLILPGNEENRP